MAIKITKVKKLPGPVPRAYRVADVAIAQGRAIGLAGDVSARLRRMARRSAPITHHDGNRRFDDFILRVENNVVQSVNRI